LNFPAIRPMLPVRYSRSLTRVKECPGFSVVDTRLTQHMLNLTFVSGRSLRLSSHARLNLPQTPAQT
jgi:hypothetical protein